MPLITGQVVSSRWAERVGRLLQRRVVRLDGRFFLWGAPPTPESLPREVTRPWKSLISARAVSRRGSGGTPRAGIATASVQEKQSLGPDENANNQIQTMDQSSE